MQKVFAYDLDGTLLMKNNKVHPQTKEMMKKSSDAGHIHVIATGRGIKKVMPLLDSKEIENIDYIVCSNGALVYNVKTKDFIVLNSLDPTAFEVLREVAEKHDLILTLDTPNFNGSYLPNKSFPKWMSEEQIMDMNIVYNASLQDLYDVIKSSPNSITQIALRNPITKAQRITDEIRNKLKKDQYNIYLTNSVYTDVNPINTSKWKGLEKVLELTNNKVENLIVFGDSGNDIEMIANAGVGICMENGTNEAKQVAKKVIGHHETDTIGQVIKDFTAC